MIQGNCYWGAVKYEIRGQPLKFLICQCPDCRKFTKAPWHDICDSLPRHPEGLTAK